MKIRIVIFFLCLVSLTSFGLHKFYVGMFQLEFVPKKQEIQITTRLFIDDMNEALKNKYNTTTHLGEKNETGKDEELLMKYLEEKFIVKVNKQPKKYVFLFKEYENNVVICYLKIRDISKVTSLHVENSILTEIYSEQQNIIQFNNNGKKSSLLLTDDKTYGVLN